ITVQDPLPTMITTTGTSM
nr:immunoglobulin heavy chain junction region [Mus musculus]